MKSLRLFYKYSYTSIDGPFDLTSYFQEGDHDVISRRKVLPSGQCTRGVYGSVRHFTIYIRTCRIIAPRYIGLSLADHLWLYGASAVDGVVEDG